MGNRRRWCPQWVPGCLLLLLGCETGPAAPESQPAPAGELAAEFEPSTAGTIRGQVTWAGELPMVPPFVTRVCPIAMAGLRERQVHANPNAPDIDRNTRAVRGAVVFLRDVPLRRSRPWNLPSVQVEFRDHRLHVMQGGEDTRVGFVRRGDVVSVTSREPLFHSLQARRAAFFTLALPDQDQAASRRLDESGIVELADGAGFYWMRAHLFVDEHPYYVRTGADGRFELTRVPPGRHEVVCWMPNWNEARHERDPESGLIVRVFFKAAMERVQTVTLAEGAAEIVNFVVEKEAFPR